MKKILFYTPFITAGGGLQKVLLDYVNGLSSKGYIVDIIADFNMGEATENYISSLDSSINFQYIKSEKVSKFIYYFRTLGKKYTVFNIFLYAFMIIFDFYYYHTKVKHIVKSGNYDFTISFYQFLPAYITSIKTSKHLVWLHGSVDHYFGGITKLFKNSYGRKLERYDYVVTIANEMKEQLIEFYPKLAKDKIKRIYNPFDFNTIQMKSQEVIQLTSEEKKLLEDDYICTVSRLDEVHKDNTLLIKTYKKLYEENKITHKLYIIGDGPHKGILEDLVKKLKLEEKVLFLGQKTNPFVWMKHAELFILPSKTEGLPTVLIEAMAVETFVISSRCKTGPKEILQDGKYGELFEVGNIDELSDKIYDNLDHEEYKNAKIASAFKSLERFSYESTFKDIEKII